MARAGARRIAVPQAHAEPAQSGAGGAGRDQRCVAGGRCLRSLRSPELGDQVLCGCADAARGDPDPRPRRGFSGFRAGLGQRCRSPPCATPSRPSPRACSQPGRKWASSGCSAPMCERSGRSPPRISATSCSTWVCRRGPEVVRSLRPTHAVAVWGNNVDAIVAGHHVAGTPCGRPTPYGRLLEYDGKILFAGVPVSTMTFFHFVEEELEPRMPFPVFAPEGYALRWKDEAGAVGVSRMRLFSLRLAGHRDLNPLASELQRRKQWREWRVGRLGLILLRARDVYDATFALAERGVFCYERQVLAGRDPWSGT